jgi:hypothetical protein
MQDIMDFSKTLPFKVINLHASMFGTYLGRESSFGILYVENGMGKP